MDYNHFCYYSVHKLNHNQCASKNSVDNIQDIKKCFSFFLYGCETCPLAFQDSTNYMCLETKCSEKYLYLRRTLLNAKFRKLYINNK
jgi:hypothetical protein